MPPTLTSWIRETFSIEGPLMPYDAVCLRAVGTVVRAGAVKAADPAADPATVLFKRQGDQCDHTSQGCQPGTSAVVQYSADSPGSNRAMLAQSQRGDSTAQDGHDDVGADHGQPERLLVADVDRDALHPFGDLLDVDPAHGLPTCREINRPDLAHL